VQPLIANGGIERVEVLDAAGGRVYGARLVDGESLEYASIVDSADRSSLAIVQRTLAAEASGVDKFTDVVATDDGYTLYTAGPILDGENVAGVVLIGTSVTSFLATAKVESLTDVTLHDASGAPLATTFASTSSRDAELAPSERALAAAGDGLVREHRTLFGRDFDLMYAPLSIGNEGASLYYSVGLPSEFIFSAQASTREQMALLFTIAMLAALALGWIIAQSITRPVSKLVAAANAVGAGDLSARSGVGGEDEIGVLGRAFDEMTERLQRQHLSTVKALTSAIDARDPYTMGHSLRVGQLAVELGTVLGCSQATLQHLEIGGYLHDIGKIGVRDNVLLKPGRLTPQERAAIERHPTIGLDILEHVDLAPEVRQFVGGHHEKLNGRGYPDHLHGDQLGVIPRIATVADIYDALVTDRPYRAGMSVEQALAILEEEAAEGQLDRKVIAALKMVVPGWEERRKTDPALRGFNMQRTSPERKAA
jgi:putative nucleotidyltransferase with HDIG domain